MWLKPRDSRRAERKNTRQEILGLFQFSQVYVHSKYAAGPLQFAMAEHTDTLEQQD
jgi:hypothetical protein